MVDIFDRLRDLPDEHFRIALKEKLMQAANTTAEITTYLPEGFRSITPYLITKSALDVMAFLKAAFGATEKMRVLQPDGKLMHGEVVIGDSVVEISDGSEQYPPSPVALHLYVPDVDASYARAIESGAISLSEPADQEYGERSAAVRDAGGNNWYIATYLNAPGSYVPEGMHSITPFLHSSSAAGQIRFLVDGLGGEELVRDTDGGSIRYAKVQVGNGILELSQAREQWPAMRASTHVHVPDVDVVYERALAAGGTSISPVADQPYGERSGGVRDPFGNCWWIATHTGKMG